MDCPTQRKHLGTLLESIFLWPNAEILAFPIWARTISLSVTVAEALKTSDDFQPTPQSAVYPADLDSSRLQEIHCMTFVQLDDCHLQSSANRIRKADLQLVEVSLSTPPWT